MPKDKKEKEVKEVKGGVGQKMYIHKATSDILEKAISSNLPVLLTGETGTGKTSIIRESASKVGKRLIRLNLTGQTGAEDILGKFLASPTEGTFWIDGLLIEAMKKGHWIVFDEINMALPEILSALHSLLDDDRKIVLKEKDGEIIDCHKDFRFFATMNPSDDYVGTKELNKAFLSRFPVILDVGYSPHEEQILIDRSGIPKVDAQILVAIAKEIRKTKEKGLTSFTCSTRDIISSAQMISLGVDMLSAVKVSLINKAPREERNPIIKIVELLTDKKVSADWIDGSFTSVFDLIDKSKEQYKMMLKQSSDSKKIAEDSKKIVKASLELSDTLKETLRESLSTINKLEQHDKKLTGELSDCKTALKKSDFKLSGYEAKENK